MAVTLPVVLLILDVYPLRRLGPGRWLGPTARRVYREKVPFAILSAVFIGLAVWARSQIDRDGSTLPGSAPRLTHLGQTNLSSGANWLRRSQC